MTEPTSAEKNRLVAETFLGVWIRLRCVGCGYELARADGHMRTVYNSRGEPEPAECGPIVEDVPDFPNDPVASDALRKALAEQGWDMAFTYLCTAKDWNVVIGRPGTVSPSIYADTLDLAVRDAAYEAAKALREEP